MNINLIKNNLIYPYFVIGGKGRKEEIKSFPGQFRFSQDRLLKDIDSLVSLGLGKVLLFGVPGHKDDIGSAAYSDESVVASAIREIKKKFPSLTIFTDVCLCSYTTHGHCGILRGLRSEVLGQRYSIDNEQTVKVLAKIALSHANAGADFVAPSAMAKKQVEVIREALDGNGHKMTKVMGYSAKFASNFYGPFRNAADSTPKFGDRRGYQLDYSDSKKALKEIEDDIKEGASIVMVKPALGYFDIIKEAKQRFDHPIAAYNVSGEYAMVKAYVRSLVLGRRREAEKNIVLEIMTGIKRAGADLIITYHAKDIAKWIKK